jgi:hypothetical protein
MLYINNIMRKKADLNIIAERYASQVLNEMVPFAAGEHYGDPQKDEYKLDDREEWKAADKYPKMTGDLGSNPAFAEIMSSITDAVGAHLLQAIEDENGEIPDSKQEVAKRASEVIKSIKVGGRPLFTPSHTVHVARNIVDALVRSGTIKELPRTRSGGGGKPARPSNTEFGASDLSFS